ncbi:MAG: molecular chaperone DnaJ [Pseudanabaena sp.]|nr:MAG: molecular chaperone DnaJ [Pseudanabaena sp.]
MNQSKASKIQFIRIDRGISQFNHDYYAALGLPISYSPEYIRHVYLNIARILHPDIYGFSDEEKEIATQYLAKLVNPAYDVLMREEERRAYQGIFKLLAKRLMQKSRNLPIHSAIACKLMMTPNDFLYERSVLEIANVQYKSLKTILEYTAQISELNLVYILYKEGYQYGADNMPPVLVPTASTQSPKPYSANYPTPPQKTSYAYPPQYSIYQPPSNRKPDSDETIIQTRIEEQDASAISDRLKICEIYISQCNWKSALKDLREILQLDKNNSKCHAMLGVVYQNINQPQMAKVSFQRSLQINPQEPLALKCIKDLVNPNTSQTRTKKDTKSVPKPNPNANKTPLPPPQKRGWLANLLGWASPDNRDDSRH